MPTALAVFAHDLRKTLFVHKNPIFLGDLLFEILRYAYVFLLFSRYLLTFNNKQFPEWTCA